MQIDLVAGVDLGRTIERKVVAIFADQHTGQQAWAWAPAHDRARGQFGFGATISIVSGRIHRLMTKHPLKRAERLRNLLD